MEPPDPAVDPQPTPGYEGTPWEEVRRRLQKEFGGGRWTPEEDTLRMLRLTRRSGQSKGEFTAHLLMNYQEVVDKFRETLPGPEAAARLAVIESLLKVQLGEAIGRPVAGEFTAEAHAVIDAAGRGEEEDGGEWRRVTRGWRPAYPRADVPRRRREDPGRRREDGRGRRPEEPRRADRRSPVERGTVTRRGSRQPEDRRCFTCGRSGHLQARCSEVACYQCGRRGHMARRCPYRPPQRRDKGEPMEVNAHRPGRRTRSQAAKEGDTTGSDGDISDGSGTTTSDASIVTYAAVVKKRKAPTRSAAGREQGP